MFIEHSFQFNETLIWILLFLGFPCQILSVNSLFFSFNAFFGWLINETIAIWLKYFHSNYAFNYRVSSSKSKSNSNSSTSKSYNNEKHNRIKSHCSCFAEFLCGEQQIDLLQYRKMRNLYNKANQNQFLRQNSEWNDMDEIWMKRSVHF